MERTKTNLYPPLPLLLIGLDTKIQEFYRFTWTLNDTMQSQPLLFLLPTPSNYAARTSITLKLSASQVHLPFFFLFVCCFCISFCSYFFLLTFIRSIFCGQRLTKCQCFSSSQHSSHAPSFKLVCLPRSTFHFFLLLFSLLFLAFLHYLFCCSLIYRSEVVPKSQSPNWGLFKLNINLCGGLDAPLTIEVYLIVFIFSPLLFFLLSSLWYEKQVRRTSDARKIWQWWLRCTTDWYSDHLPPRTHKQAGHAHFNQHSKVCTSHYKSAHVILIFFFLLSFSLQVRKFVSSNT